MAASTSEAKHSLAHAALLVHVQSTMRDLAGDMSDGELLDAYDSARWGLSALCDDIETLEPSLVAIQQARIAILAAVLSERARARIDAGRAVFTQPVSTLSEPERAPRPAPPTRPPGALLFPKRRAS